MSDGIDALKVLETQSTPLAVILDLALPRLGGRDVGLELKASAHTRHVPIIVVTGTDARESEGLDIECVLRKPVRPEKLIHTVEVCIRKGVAGA